MTARPPAVLGAMSDLDDPSPQWTLITPADGAGVQDGGPWRGIAFTGAGDLALQDEDGNALPIIPSGALAAGVIHPLIFARVKSAGTSAIGIVGFK